MQILGDKGGILKSCPKVPKLGMGPNVTKISAFPPAFCEFWPKNGGIFERYPMTSEGLGEMFKGDFADTCANRFSLTETA